MKNSKIIIIWSISLFVISIATIILAGINVIGIELPEAIVRTIVIVEIIALPVLVFTSIKRIKK